MGVAGISVVYLYAADLERSVRFYRDLLGIPLEADAHDPGWWEASFAGGTRFALHAAHEGAEPRAGGMQLTFRVLDLEATLERLRAVGVEAGEIAHEAWGDYCEVADPDGYRIGLLRT